MHLTHHARKRALADQVVDRISEFYTGQRSYDRKALDQIAFENLYAVTLKADERWAKACKAKIAVAGQLIENPDDPRPYHDVRFEFTEINHIMNVLNYSVYGSKWLEPARRAQLPVAGFFVDFDGSRLCLEAPPLCELRGIHHHGFIGLPVSKRERAADVIPNLMKTIWTKHPMLFNNYEISLLDPARRQPQHDDGRSVLENWVEYALKGTAHLMADERRATKDIWTGELYRLYPNPNGQTYNYLRPPIGSPDRKVPFEAEHRAV